MEQSKFKIVFLGKSAVGKTSLIQRIVDNKFELTNATIGNLQKQKLISTKWNQNILLDIWDTGGQEKFRSLAKIAYRAADFILFVYDVNDISKDKDGSFDSLENYWFQEVMDTCQNKDVCYFLIANKIDLNENNNAEMIYKGKQLAKDKELIFIQTSCKHGTGIFELLEAIKEKIDEMIYKRWKQKKKQEAKIKRQKEIQEAKIKLMIMIMAHQQKEQKRCC